MPLQQRSEETRARILSAALACFSRSGYDATGVAEICAAAEVSKGAFYHHFPSKQAVFLELLNAWLALLDARFAQARGASRSVPEALQAMAHEAGRAFSDGRGQLPMFLEFWTQSTRDPLVWAKTVEPYRRYESYLAGMLVAGMAEGSLRDGDPQAGARLLMGLVVGLLIQGLADPGETDWGKLIEQGIATLLNGMMR